MTNEQYLNFKLLSEKLNDLVNRIETCPPENKDELRLMKGQFKNFDLIDSLMRIKDQEIPQLENKLREIRDFMMFKSNGTVLLSDELIKQLLLKVHE